MFIRTLGAFLLWFDPFLAGSLLSSLLVFTVASAMRSAVTKKLASGTHLTNTRIRIWFTPRVEHIHQMPNCESA